MFGSWGIMVVPRNIIIYFEILRIIHACLSTLIKALWRPWLKVEQDVVDPFKGLKPCAPGVLSAENSDARHYFLRQNEGGESSGKSCQKFCVGTIFPFKNPSSSHELFCKHEQLSSSGKTFGFNNNIWYLRNKCVLQQQQNMTVLLDTVSYPQKSLNATEIKRYVKRKQIHQSFRSGYQTHP